MCLNSQRSEPAAFHFCSSVSATAFTPSKHIKEEIDTDFSHAQDMGYAQSKLTTENICSNAALNYGLISRVFRVGQICGDSVHGVWNATEAICLIFRGALTIGVVPELDEMDLWLPVDSVANCIVELSSISSVDAPLNSLFNVVNPRAFHWTKDLIPSMRTAGLKFDVLPQREWMARLRASNPDPVVNPVIMLVDFFASKYDRDQPVSDDKVKGFTYDTEKACSFSPSLASAPLVDAGLIKKFVSYWSTNSWLSESQKSEIKKVVIVAGPSGSGKTTIAKIIAGLYPDFHMIEGDEIHSEEAILKMSKGVPLTDADRELWLQKIRGIEIGSNANLVISCSALKKVYRDRLRDVGNAKLKVLFILCEASKETLHMRLQSRQNHYMKMSMVKSQLEIFERSTYSEDDVIPFDTSSDPATLKIMLRDILSKCL